MQPGDTVRIDSTFSISELWFGILFPRLWRAYTINQLKNCQMVNRLDYSIQAQLTAYGRLWKPREFLDGTRVRINIRDSSLTSLMQIILLGTVAHFLRIAPWVESIFQWHSYLITVLWRHTIVTLTANEVIMNNYRKVKAMVPVAKIS